MVGGRVIEIKVRPDLGPDAYQLWCVDGNDEAAVRVRAGCRSELPKLGHEIWWQSGKVYFNGDKSWLPKVGNSYDPAQPTVRESE